MNVETLVLGINEAVADVLWYPVNADGDTLEVVLYSVEHLELGLAVFVDVVGVEIGIASRFKLLERNAGGVVHKVEDVNGQRGTYDSTCYDNYQKQ